MNVMRTFRQFACLVGLTAGLFANQAQAANEYFDINGTATGSGVASGGSYTFEASTGTGGWNTTSTGLTTATTAWVDGANFMRFSAGTDAAANNFTVTANTNHTFAGMALQTNGGGTVTIAANGGSVMNMASNSGGQGFFVGGVAAQQLMITAPLAGDAVTPLVWQGALSGTAGSLFLYGNNSGLQGGVQLNSSAGLNFNNANSFGTGTITWGAAASTGTSFTVAAPALPGDITISNPMLARNPTGTGATTNLTIGNLNGHKVTWSGGLSLVTGVASTITTNSGVLTEFSGVVTGTDATKAFTKAQTGTLILSNAGNSYAGQTTIANGVLSVPGVGNSGSNSPLGKNGTINFGATTTTGNLTYTGAGETSDKVLNLAGTTGGGTIDQSGTGLLKFTTDMTATGVGSKTLTLQGSTAGTGEIAGKIVDNGGANTTAVTKSGSGTWTLTAANTYTGGTTASAGTLAIGNNNALGGGQLTLGGGTIAASGGARTIANNTVINANSSVSGTNALTFGTFTNSGGNRVLSSTNTATTTLVGPVYLSEAAGTGRTLILAGSTTNNPVFTISGNISDFNGSGQPGSIQVGNGSTATQATLNLTGTNTHSGATNVSTASLLNIGSAGALGTSTLTATGNGSFDNTTGSDQILANNVALSGGSPTYVGSANNLTLGNVAISGANRSLTVTAKTLSVKDVTQDVAGRNFTKGGAGKLVVRGAGSYTGSTTISGGVLQVGDGGTTGSLSSSGIVDNANLTINRSNSITQSTGLTAGVISGTGSLTQGGSGILTLDGANIYGGGTTVSTGTLWANNTTGSATGTGAVTVNAGATLGGTGSISGAVTVNGTLSPGNSIESLDTGALTFGAGSNHLNELNTNLALAVASDLVNAAGALTIDPTTVLNVTDAGSTKLPYGTKFTLISYSGAWVQPAGSHLQPNHFAGLPNGSSFTVGQNQWNIRYDDPTGGLNFGGGTFANHVTITAVPEASTFIVIGLGGIFAFAAVRLGKRMGFNVLKA